MECRKYNPGDGTPIISQPRTGTRRTWTTNLLCHRDYCIGCWHSGNSLLAHIGTTPLARSSATRPAGRRYPCLAAARRQCALPQSSERLAAAKLQRSAFSVRPAASAAPAACALLPPSALHLHRLACCSSAIWLMMQIKAPACLRPADRAPRPVPLLRLLLHLHLYTWLWPLWLLWPRAVPSLQACKHL